ncbi:hypothetical protein ACVWWH_002836 [Sinomonas sp. RB5]
MVLTPPYRCVRPLPRSGTHVWPKRYRRGASQLFAYWAQGMFQSPKPSSKFA